MYFGLCLLVRLIRVCNGADLHVTGIRGGKKTMKILNRNYYPVEPLMLICGN